MTTDPLLPLQNNAELSTYSTQHDSLKTTLNRYISSELDLFENNKELRFRTYGLMLNHVAVLRHKGQEGSFMDLGGKSPSMETGSSKCGAFSLAEL